MYNTRSPDMRSRNVESSAAGLPVCHCVVYIRKSDCVSNRLPCSVGKSVSLLTLAGCVRSACVVFFFLSF